ncbi:MAG: hypothetical protein AUK34_14895 [Ignavibacteria bacterium CG2_30_36_16]|nr:MAG: hypothetical protein AUK34_14895 [Ignavibacteria bacterium CG2_30_36_16]
MKSAAPNKAPAENDIRPQSLLWLNLIENKSPAPNIAETTAATALIKIIVNINFSKNEWQIYKERS